MYPLAYILNDYIPARVGHVWPKYRKFYGGDRDDLVQAAIVAILEAVRNKNDDEREKIVGCEQMVETAIVAEVRSNARRRGAWIEWPTFEAEDGEQWQVEFCEDDRGLKSRMNPNFKIVHDALRKITKCSYKARIFCLYYMFDMDLTTATNHWNRNPQMDVESDLLLQEQVLAELERIRDELRETIPTLSGGKIFR